MQNKTLSGLWIPCIVSTASQNKRRGENKSIYGLSSVQSASNGRKPYSNRKKIISSKKNAKKSNLFSGNDLSWVISNSSSIRKAHSNVKEWDIMNTSAPVRISDYISGALALLSVTPKWQQARKDSISLFSTGLQKENKQPNKSEEAVTSAVRIAQKLQEYNLHPESILSKLMKLYKCG